MTAVTRVASFERFFRAAADLEVSADDLPRYGELVNQKVRDLLVRGGAAARANGREIVEPFDLPLTRGLAECVRAFEELHAEAPLKPALEDPSLQPGLATYSEETEAEIPRIVGGLTVALARTLAIMDPERKAPRAEDWDRAVKIVNLLI